eukprot:9542673-Heterocapsa_arctica.AAC.1
MGGPEQPDIAHHVETVKTLVSQQSALYGAPSSGSSGSGLGRGAEQRRIQPVTLLAGSGESVDPTKGRPVLTEE